MAPVGTDNVGLPGSESRGQGWQKYFINGATIESVEDFSGEGFDWMSGKYGAPDIALRVTIKPDGVDTSSWDQKPTIDLFGNFDTDPEGRIEGASSAFTVLQSLKALGLSFSADQVPVDIPGALLEAMVGARCMTLRYVTSERDDGDGYFYNYFRRLGAHPDAFDNLTEEEAEEWIEGAFKRENDAGYPKDYAPQLIDEDDASMPNSGSPETTSQGQAEAETFEPDDDLPF